MGSITGDLGKFARTQRHASSRARHGCNFAEAPEESYEPETLPMEELETEQGDPDTSKPYYVPYARKAPPKPPWRPFAGLWAFYREISSGAWTGGFLKGKTNNK